MLRRVLAAALVVLFSAPAVWAQPAVPLAIDFSVPGVTAYDAAVPTPQDVLGYTIGERHTRPEEVIRYVEAVAAASPRVTAGFHGTTYEGRRLVHATVTTPANHGRLEAIRQANVSLSEGGTGPSDAQLASMPVVVYQGFSVHGNEATGTEAALVYLYHLAAGQGPAVEEALAQAVVLIDPMLNPDGRDRFVDWVNGYRGAVPVGDPQDLEHDEAWPGGRTNHYWFDLNRDWLPQQLQESRGRMAWWHSWRPQVSTDHHEMGGEATFFFQPGIPSRNNPNTPVQNYDLTGAIAAYHAAALDRIGSLYYSEESFDDFYYGKGSTYPDVQGAVGILFEQASSRALQVETRGNGLLTYAFGVRNQLATAISTLDAVVDLRENLLRYQRDFYAGFSEAARQMNVGGYLIGLQDRRTRGQALAQTLRRSRIAVHELAQDVTVGGRRYAAGQAYLIPTDQPQGRLLKAAMERTLEYGDSLFYDVSAWTFPLAFGADVAELDRVPAGALGRALDTVPMDGGRLVGGRASYAYLIPWDRYFAPRALRRLQEAGARVRLALDPFETTAGGSRRAFDRGTLVVALGAAEDSEAVHAAVAEAVAEDHVTAYAAGTGLTGVGNDLGSRAWPVLQKPTIGLVVGPRTSPYGIGEVWHLLGERIGQPASLLNLPDLAGMDLRDYTTIVLADGFFSGLDDRTAEALTTWVRGGGTLVGIEGGARWAAGLLGAEDREAKRDTTLEVPYADRSATFGAQQIGGSIFEVRLDTTHPLAFGYGETVAVFKGDAQLLEPGDPLSGVDVGRYTDEPVLSGYISPQNLERLPGASALKAGRLGRGRVIALDFNPAFRAFWWGTDGLLLNALYFGDVW